MPAVLLVPTRTRSGGTGGGGGYQGPSDFSILPPAPRPPPCQRCTQLPAAAAGATEHALLPSTRGTLGWGARGGSRRGGQVTRASSGVPGGCPRRLPRPVRRREPGHHVGAVRWSEAMRCAAVRCVALRVDEADGERRASRAGAADLPASHPSAAHRSDMSCHAALPARVRSTN